MSNAETTAAAERHCLRCGRKLTAAKGAYGRTCERKIRAAALEEARRDFTAEQQAKAAELIRDGGMVPHPHAGVFTAVSSKGDATYLAHPAACNCPAGIKGRRCYHLLAARVLTIASRRSLAKAA